MAGVTGTYYLRDWPQTVPSYFLLEGVRSNILDIVRLSLPFIGILYEPAGRFISYSSDLLNLLDCCISPAPQRIGYGQICFMTGGLEPYQRIGKAVKASLELRMTFQYGLRQGLITHTSMNLVESIYDLRHFPQYSLKGKFLSMIPVISNALYLATFYAGSKRMTQAAMAISLAFQAGVSLYRGYVANSRRVGWKNIQVLDMASHLALAGIFTTKAYKCFINSKDFIKLSNEHLNPDENEDLKAGGLESTEIPVSKATA